MLPRVKLYFESGALGSVTPSEDGTAGLVATGVAVSSTFALATAYLLTKLDDLTPLGITSAEDDDNAAIYKLVKDFYTEAPEGTKLWLYAVADTVTMAQMCDKTLTHAKNLIEAANGSIKFLMISRTPAGGYTPTILDGLDSDVYSAMSKAQELAEWATDTKYAPVFVILEGRSFSGVSANLRDLNEESNNRVTILIGDTESDSGKAAIGLLGGRIASIPVQRSIARVRSGAVPADEIFIKDKTAENGSPDVISDKGFITFRTFVGKSGYYFTDDKMAVSATDDYALIPRRRVIDKAYRYAYQTMVEELGEEIPVTSEGTMPAAVVKNIQSNVELAIIRNMPGNLGADPSDPNDSGVECFIDHTQQIVSTSKFDAKLRVKPFGYPKYIDVYLGYKSVTV